jgi:hypothetical protein
LGGAAGERKSHRQKGISMLRRLLVVCFCLAASTAVAAGTAGAAVFTVSAGENPGLAIGTDGTGYVVWNDANPAGAATHFCKVPRGATACLPGSQKTFATPAEPGQELTDTSGPRVFVDSLNPNRVEILIRRDGFPQESFVVHSEDFGATFAPSTAALAGNFRGSEHGDSILTPTHPPETSTGIVSMDSSDSSQGTVLQRVLTEPAAQETNEAAIGGTSGNPFSTTWYDGAVSYDGTDLTAALSDGTNAYFRTHTGGVTNASVNNIANWSALKEVGPGFDTHLAGGPSGTWLLAATGADFSYAESLRHFNAATGAFDPLTALSDPAQIELASIYEQPDTGALFAAWRNQTLPGLFYWNSAIGGKGFAINGEASDFNVKVEGLTAFDGWAVWSTGGNVRMQPLSDAQAIVNANKPPPPPPPGPGTGTKTPPVFKGKTGSTSESAGAAGGLPVTFVSPKVCVPAINSVYLKLLTKGRKVFRVRKGGRITHVNQASKVVFSIDKKIFHTDKTRSYTALLSPLKPVAFKTKSKHVLRVKVYVTTTYPKHGRTKKRVSHSTRQIARTLKIC